MEETLQYLNVEPQYTEDEMQFVDILVPSVIGKTKSEAQKAIENSGLKAEIYGDGDKITSQMPVANSKVSKNSNIILYTDKDDKKQTVTVPDVRNCTPAEANKLLTDAGLNVKIKGVTDASGTAVCSGQSPAAGTSVEMGTVITLDFTYSGVRD